MSVIDSDAVTELPRVQVEASLLLDKDQKPLGLITSDDNTHTIASDAGQNTIMSELKKVDPEAASAFANLMPSLTTSITSSLADLDLADAKTMNTLDDTLSDPADSSHLPPPSSPNRLKRLSISPVDSSETLIEASISSSVAKKLNFDEDQESIPTPQLVAVPSEKAPIPSKKDSKLDIDEQALLPLSRIPRFHFPFGKPGTQEPLNEGELRGKLAPIFDEFKKKELVKLESKDFEPITALLDLPRYLNISTFTKVTSVLGTTELTLDAFTKFWTEFRTKYVDEIALVFGILLPTQDSTFLTPDDIKIPVQDVTLNHPGLAFLSSLPVFQNRYMETVIARLFYAKNKNWNKKMTLPEFRKSGFVAMLRNLEKIEDINTTLDIFSYQHFYVIYCRFWELDRDHDMVIDFNALQNYDGGSMTDAILKRVIEGYGKPSSLGRGSRAMSYEDFIWFILSVEDKRTPYAVEYWFRCLDLDGDGQISLHELQHFFEDQFKQMRFHSFSDTWKFPDFVCSLMDLIKPKKSHVITLADLKHCRGCSLFFDMLFDLNKYDSHIRRIDPSFREEDDVFISGPNGERVRLDGFQKFAAKTYEILAREEAQQGSQQYIDLDEDFLEGDESGAFQVMQDLDWDNDVNEMPWVAEASQ